MKLFSNSTGWCVYRAVPSNIQNTHSDSWWCFWYNELLWYSNECFVYISSSSTHRHLNRPSVETSLVLHLGFRVKPLSLAAAIYTWYHLLVQVVRQSDYVNEFVPLLLQFFERLAQTCQRQNTITSTLAICENYLQDVITTFQKVSWWK